MGQMGADKRAPIGRWWWYEVKKECVTVQLYGLYCTLHTLKIYLIGVRKLIIEVDARYINGMLQNPDITPNASINRWIVSILTYHFELVLIPGTSHVPDGLSRRYPQLGDEPRDDDDDFEDWIDQLHGFLHQILPIPTAVSRARSPIQLLALATGDSRDFSGEEEPPADTNEDTEIAQVSDNANTNPDESEVKLPIFLTAGYETTSTGAMWTIYALTQNPNVERRLLEELNAVQTDFPNMDELQILPYLDAVVREALRLHAPLPSTLRVAVEDDVIPLNKAFVDHDGHLCDRIEIAAGTTIDVPILALNRAESPWGDDALEFRPERWDSLPQVVNGIPKVWSNIMTFIGRPRACIGYRFAMLEIKALIFVLLRAFRFGPSLPSREKI
ncbi:cytochrome P450 [Fomitopsis betulina]|nr:cytochrome P450 [Fomitopsis betulina]